MKTRKQGRIILCPNCQKPEYYGNMHFIEGYLYCRRCTAEAFQREYGKHYPHSDLSGDRPTYRQFIMQVEEKKKKREKKKC